jgi:hypothetical protein
MYAKYVQIVHFASRSQIALPVLPIAFDAVVSRKSPRADARIRISFTYMCQGNYHFEIAMSTASKTACKRRSHPEPEVTPEMVTAALEALRPQIWEDGTLMAAGLREAIAESLRAALRVRPASAARAPKAAD